MKFDPKTMMTFTFINFSTNQRLYSHFRENANDPPSFGQQQQAGQAQEENHTQAAAATATSIA